jgi:putative ABC transport system substrate-binding protein
MAAVGGAAAIWPILAQAQERGLKRSRIGCVFPGSPETSKPLAAALEQRLAELGYQNGRNINIVIRIVAPQLDIVENVITALLPDIDILMVVGTIGAVSAKKVAPQMPTVFCAVGSPVEIGLVQSLAHPGGLMTGITFEATNEAYGKRLQTLKQIVPQLGRVAVLRASGDANVKPAMAALEQAAPQLGVTVSGFDLHSADDLDNAFGDMQKRSMEAVIVVPGNLTYANYRRISELALKAHLPSCTAVREAVIAGGLLSIGPDVIDIVRQVPIYLDKIMHGASPADLPVAEPTRFDTYINLKTGTALGLTIPPSLIATADEVIE